MQLLSGLVEKMDKRKLLCIEFHLGQRARYDFVSFLFGDKFFYNLNDQSPEIGLPFPLLKDDLCCEKWLGLEPVKTYTQNGFLVIKNSDYLLLGAAVSAKSGEDFEEDVKDLYIELLNFVSNEGFVNLVRFWNIIPNINYIDNGLERYKRFCRARNRAFVYFFSTHKELIRNSFPAASGVGSKGEEFIVLLLATKFPCKYIENPRQVSAYNYPPIYGPKPPSFARATLVKDEVFVVSGTASIVGHRSLHLGDPRRQLYEIEKNIKSLLSCVKNGSNKDVKAVRVYIRNRNYYSLILEEINKLYPAALIVMGDICRKELILEIETSLCL